MSVAFKKALASGYIFLDGSMGTILQSVSFGREAGWKVPEELNLTHPDLICKIHTQYLDAGATVILTNTFGANSFKLSEYGYDAAQVVTEATKIARKAVSAFPGRFVAVNIGPTGQMLEPMGTCSFDDAYAAFAEMAKAAEKAGADLAVIETMSDLYELRAAVLAVKENTKLPVIASATFQDNNRTLTGATPETVVAVMEGLGVDAVGFNCGGDLNHARQLAQDFLAVASIPVFVEPNAGIPIVEDRKTIFVVTPDEFAETMVFCAKAGARVLGGCCGTTHKHIASMVKSCLKVKPRAIEQKNTTLVTSWCDTVTIADDARIIGERINPTGKKKMREAILSNNYNFILSEAQSQIDAGAHILDVNVGLPGIDEQAVMLSVVRALQRTFPVPLQIDSSEPAVLESALRYYNGKALVNSVNGKAEVMDAVFPIVKKYGGVVVGLTLDEDGIPSTAEGRLAVAEKIVNRAQVYGISPKNILIDTLTLTVSSQQKEAMETVKAITLVEKKLGVKTVLGVSNISFGLPQRELVNSVFFATALNAGLSACIINPLSTQMMGVYRTWRALSGLDEHCLAYIDTYSNTTAITTAVATPKEKTEASAKPEKKGTADDDLYSIITAGLRDRSRAATEILIQTKTPLEIIDGYIVPALDVVGKDFESGKKFLPQLLLSAETVSRAFEVIKEELAKSGKKSESKGTIILATVHGDIHDIGKNIVKAMLENYGYTVIDLGRDVPPQTVVETALTEKPGIIGLSALMTTTVANMEKTILALKEAGVRVPIIVGGAVLSPEYANKIGADYYAKDAMAAISIAKSVFGS
ncbi:MAG TPA: dihydropteroate synthase [Treponema sp.]|nr:dihydropteroate synthase [Treponema sp.]